MENVSICGEDPGATHLIQIQANTGLSNLIIVDKRLAGLLGSNDKSRFDLGRVKHAQ